MPGAVPVPGASMYPPQFTHGVRGDANPFHRMSSYAAAGVGNIPTGLSTIGMVAGVGSMFTANPAMRGLSFLDPTTAGWEVGAARYGAARAAGLGMGEALGAGMMGAAGPLALGYAAYSGARYAGQQFMTGARDYGQVAHSMGGMGFVNPAAPGGHGFGAGQSRQIYGAMQEFQRQDPFTGMQDMLGMMNQFTDMKMNRGVADAQEMGKKLTALSKTVIDMAKALNTSVDDATRQMGQMRSSGFYTAADVMGNTRQMRMMKGQGMDESMFHGMQAQGAATTRAMGMSGRGGALSAARFSSDLLMGATSRASGGTGLFNDEELMDITGAGSGAEAAAQMGTDLTATMSRFLTSSAAGRAFMASLGEKKDGRFTGGLDRGMLAKFAGGKITEDQIAGIGGGKLDTAGSKASFTLQTGKIASSLMADEQGVDAMLTSIEQEARKHFKGTVTGDDAIMLFYEKQLGGDRRVMEKLLETRKHQLEGRVAKMKALRQEAAAAALSTDLAQNYTLVGLMKQLEGGLSDVLGVPIQNIGADFKASMDRTAEHAWDSVTGTARAGVSDHSRKDSLMRLATGTAHLGGGARASAFDFEKGTAGRALAMSATWSTAESSRGGLDRARALQVKLALGGTLTAEDTGVSASVRDKLQAFTASDAGQKAQRFMKRAQQARAIGDEDEYEKLMGEAQGLMEQNVIGRRDAGVYRSSGVSDQYFAETARQMGYTGAAAEIMGLGSVKDHGYEDVKKLTGDVLSAYKEAGISSELAEQFTTGKAGGSLMSAISGRGAGGMDFFETLEYDHEAKDQLGEMARAASRKLGGNYTASDVEAVLKAQGQVRSYARADRAKSMIGGLNELNPFAHLHDYMAAGGLSEQDRLHAAQERLAAGGASLTKLVDRQVLGTETQAAAAALGAASDEMKAALGGDLDKALASLATVSSGAALDEKQQQVVVKDMSDLLKRAEREGIGAMTGGLELGRLATQQSVALEAAKNSNIQGILDAFGGGYTESDIRKLVGKESKNDVLSNADLQAAVEKIAGTSVLDAFGSSAGGGIYRRGATAEQIMLMNVQAVTTSVTKLAETVDTIAYNVQGDGKPLTKRPDDTPG